jgi:hypothetical protein
MKTSTREHRRAVLALALATALSGAVGCATVSGLDSLTETTGDGGTVGDDSADATVGSSNDNTSNNNNNNNNNNTGNGDSGSSGSTTDAGSSGNDASFDAGKDTGPLLEVTSLPCKNYLCGYDGSAPATICCWNRNSNNMSYCDKLEGGIGCPPHTTLPCEGKDDCYSSANPYCCLNTGNEIAMCGTASTCMSNNYKALCKSFADCPDGGGYTQCAPSGNLTIGNLSICK